MRNRFRFISLIPAICLLLAAPVLLAQTTGTIEGTITDQNGGTMPGVSVELSSPNLQGVRTATTAANGKFRFVSLPPGSYKVTASISGFGTVQKNATVTLDATSTVNMQMAVATTASVTVSGEAPLIDTASTTTGTNYSSKVISQLPVGRNYADIVRSQPGVQTDYGETQGRSLALSIYGATSAENLFLIDGVNTTNVIKSFQGKSLNPEFIQEVEVKTGGYQAEYGRNTGGVVNVITKSGGNEFHGDAFGYYNSKGLRANYKTAQTADFSQTGDTNNRTVTDKDTRWDYGADLGGFMVKDRLWFFGAFDRLDQKTTYYPLTGIRANTRFPLDFTSNLYSGKITANILTGTSLVGTVFGDPQDNVGAINTPRSTNVNSFTGTRKLGGLDWAARLNQLFGSSGIFTFQYGEHGDKFRTVPLDTSLIQVRDRSVSPLVAFGGFGSVFGPTVNNESKRKQLGGSMTFYFGPNELKLGGDYQKDNTFGSTFYTGGQRIDLFRCTAACDLSKAPTVVNAAGQSIRAYYSHQTFTPSGTDLTPLPEAPFNVNTNRYGIYLQDQIRIGASFTANLGVRYDSESYKKGNKETAFDLKNQWAPRFGFVWDFLGDGTSKFYASAGRFFYAIPTDLNARVFTANTQLINYNYSANPSDNFQDATAPRRRLIQVGSFDGEPVDKGTKASYQDELTIGVEKALDPTFSVGLKYTYRTLGRTVEDRCDLDYNSPLTQYNSCAIMNPGGKGPAASGAYPTCDSFSNTGDPNAGACGLPGVPIPEARRLFRGIEVTARKAFSQQLWAQASYLYSTLRGNYSGAIREASGQTDPGINADYDYWQFTLNSYGNLELDRPHQFRLDAVYTAPFGLALGFQGFVRSGQPINVLGYYNQFYPDLLYLQKRGSAGRQPTEVDMNLSLGYAAVMGPVTVTPTVYAFNLINNQTVQTADDGFNTFNGSWTPGTQQPFFGTANLDNPNYKKAVVRGAPRLFRFSLKVTF